MTEMLRNEGLKRVRMRLITAVIFVFTLTCSGSFGMEDVVSSSGPGPDAAHDPHPAARVERADGVRRLRAGVHGPRGRRSLPLDPPRHGRVLELPGRLVVDALPLRRLRRLRGAGARLHRRPSAASVAGTEAHHRHRHRGRVHLHQHPRPRPHRLVADHHPDRRHGAAAHLHRLGHRRRVGEPLLARSCPRARASSARCSWGWRS